MMLTIETPALLIFGFFILWAFFIIPVWVCYEAWFALNKSDYEQTLYNRMVKDQHRSHAEKDKRDKKELKKVVRTAFIVNCLLFAFIFFSKSS